MLLLHAALAPDDLFPSRYAAWRDAVDPQPSIEAYSLLQLLAPRLRGRDDGDPLVDLCRRQYRLVWGKTRLLERRHGAILALLDHASIPCVVLKGPALQPLYYRDPGLRPMGDLDLLIQPARFGEAVTCLLEAGWRSDEFAKPHRFDVRFGRAITLDNEAGDLVDLHAHAFHRQIAWTAASGLLWADARPFAIGGIEARTLSPEHHLILQIEHATADRERNSRWIPDGMMLIRSGAIDWARLAEDAAALGLSGLVAEGLRILREFGAEIPDHALNAGTVADLDPDQAWHAIGSNADRLRFHAVTIRQAAERTGKMRLALLPGYVRFLAARRGLPWKRDRHRLACRPPQ
jgi:hypothetical protein